MVEVHADRRERATAVGAWNGAPLIDEFPMGSPPGTACRRDTGLLPFAMLGVITVAGAHVFAMPRTFTFEVDGHMGIITEAGL
jgi:hypothetical protein